jgi:hypothetical protein
VAVAWIRMNARKFHRLNKKLREKGFSKNRCKTFLSYTQSFLEYAKKQPENLTEEDIRGYIARYPNNGHLKSYLKFYYTEVLGKSLTSKSKAFSESIGCVADAPHTPPNVVSPQLIRDASALSDVQDKLEKIENEMRVRGYKELTIEKYLLHIKEFIDSIKKPYANIKEEDLINYLNEGHISSNDKAALRFFFIIILGKNISVLRGRYGRTFKEPVILNRDEVIQKLSFQKEMCIRKSGRFYCIKANTMVPSCRVTSCSFYGKCNSMNAIDKKQETQIIVASGQILPAMQPTLEKHSLPLEPVSQLL